jgi:hypothetical protein
MSYKRNQIEEAIARIFDPNCDNPPSELRTRIKRLLELDRSMGRKRGSKDSEEANFGFFTEEAPGTGADISFSEYEAFALLNGLRIMKHGWPQGFAVSIMRRVRLDLEREHARILSQREIAGTDANAKIQELARRVAEAQIDLGRVRYARHQLLSHALSNPYYDSRENVREKAAVMRSLLRWNAPDMPLAVLVNYVTSTPEGPQKFAIILSQEARPTS